MRILVVLLLLICTPAFADDPLEQLVKLTPNQLLEIKIHRVLKKRQVKSPEYYAKLIAHSKYSVKEKKIAAAILVPESRGKAKAVNYNKTCFGPWQVDKRWKKKLNISGSLYDPPTCLNAAMKVWNIHLTDSKGSVERALVAYSGGARNYVDKVNTVLRELA